MEKYLSADILHQLYEIAIERQESQSDYLKFNPEEEWGSVKSKYNQHMKIDLCLPRQSGHSTAAVEFLKKMKKENDVFIVSSTAPRTAEIMRKIPEFRECVFCATSPDKLSKKIKCQRDTVVITDTFFWAREKHSIEDELIVLSFIARGNGVKFLAINLQ